MISTPTLLMLAALSAPGQTVLLDFYSDYCGPCRGMEPTVRKLISDGYAIQKVNISTERQLARKYGVDAVPTFIMVVNGQEVRRIVGPTSYSQLTALFPPAPAAQSPTPVSFVSTSSRQASSFANASNPETTKQTAMQATVRLTVEDPTGKSFGTGTIIDACQDEALVITCAHIFRDSDGKGTIAVDVSAPGARGPVPGYLLKYDLTNDVALVAIRPGCTVQPIKVASKNCPLQVGEAVFTIGCDHGGSPSLHDSRITALNKYKAPANIEAAGQPVVGRSGGGLFSAQGQLIGVCNFADPKDDEGIYAHTSLLQDILDSVNMSRVYQQPETMLAAAEAPKTAAPPVSSPGIGSSVPGQLPPDLPRQMPPMSPVASGPPVGNEVISELSALAASGAEFTILVRPGGNPSQQQVFTISQPNPAFIQTLAGELNRQAGSQLTVLNANGPANGNTPSPRVADPNGAQNGPTMRAQSWR